MRYLFHTSSAHKFVIRAKGVFKHFTKCPIRSTNFLVSFIHEAIRSLILSSIESSILHLCNQTIINILLALINKSELVVLCSIISTFKYLALIKSTKEIFGESINQKNFTYFIFIFFDVVEGFRRN